MNDKGFHSGNWDTGAGHWPLLKRHIQMYLLIVKSVWRWIYYGGKVRRAFRRYKAEGSIYHVDRMPSGRENP